MDTSVALAHLLAEDRHPDPRLWTGTVVSSRLLEYEVWTRIHAKKLTRSHSDAVHALLGRIAFLDLISDVLERARLPFPVPVRTLDALHLASLDFLREQGQDVRLASYDDRMISAARRMKIRVYDLD